MRYLTRDELAAIVAHECAHHQNNAMFPNRVHYRSLLMFAAYHKGLAKTMSTIVKLNAKHSSFSFLFGAVAISLYSLYPLLLIYVLFLRLMGILLRNPGYEYYCDKVAMEFAGGFTFASALQKISDLHTAAGLSQKKHNGSPQGESGVEGTNTEALHLEELDREYSRLRYFDPPIRREKVSAKSLTHPPVLERLARVREVPSIPDLSAPLFSDSELQSLWKGIGVRSNRTLT
jgi:Zn-dependent protease with chaperone function